MEKGKEPTKGDILMLFMVACALTFIVGIGAMCLCSLCMSDPIDEWMAYYRSTMSSSGIVTDASSDQHSEVGFGVDDLPEISSISGIEPDFSLSSDLSDIRPEAKTPSQFPRVLLKVHREFDSKTSPRMLFASDVCPASTSKPRAYPSSTAFSSDKSDSSTTSSTQDEEAIASTSGYKKPDTPESSDSSQDQSDKSVRFK